MLWNVSSAMNIRNVNNGLPFLTWEQEFHCVCITSTGKHSSCLAGCGVWSCMNNDRPLKRVLEDTQRIVSLPIIVVWGGARLRF